MSRSYTKSVVTDAAVVTTAETACITSDPVSQAVNGEPIRVHGTVSYLTGTATTAVTMRVREGSGTSGTVVGETLPQTIAAAVDHQIPFDVSYSPNGVAGQTYTVTIQATAATGNGNIKAATITVTLG